MQCNKCGKEGIENNKFCDNCGTEITNTDKVSKTQEIYNKDRNTNIDNKTSKQKELNEKKANILCILSLLLTYSGVLINKVVELFPHSKLINFLYLSSYFTYGTPLLGIIIMANVRIKYPENNLSKLFMWLIMISIIVFYIWAINSFINDCQSGACD